MSTLTVLAIFASRVWLAMPEPPIRAQPPTEKSYSEPWRRQRRRCPF